MVRPVHDLTALSRPALESVAPAGLPIPLPPSRWKTRIALPAVVLLVLGGMLAYSASDALLPARAVEVVPVVVRAHDAGAASAQVTMQAPGWVEADPYAITVSALAEGVVKEVLALEGQRVSAGQVVARLVDDETRLALATAEAEVLEREGAIAAAEADLQAARSHWDNPIERRRAVAVAEAALAQSRAELDRLTAETAAESAKLEELTDKHQRAARTHAGGAATEVELVEARLRAAAQQAVLAATQARRPLLEAKVREQEAILAAAQEENRLRIADAQALGQAQAAVMQARAARDRAGASRDQARLRVERMEIRSPVDGVVLSRRISPGAKLVLGADDPHSATALRLYDPARLQVRVDVPLAEAARVSEGQAAQIVVGVLPDRTFTGKVTRLVHEADIQRNTVQVKVAIDSPAAEIKPEMLARVKLLAAATGQEEPQQAAHQLVFAPQRLLERDGQTQAKAWVVDRRRNVAVRRSLTLAGAAVDGWLGVRDGLQPGDLLIASDLETLREGQRVRITGEQADTKAEVR